MAAIPVMACLLLLAISKCAVYKISFMAVLLYYGEKGVDFPTNSTIQEYRLKVVKKILGIKRD